MQGYSIFVVRRAGAGKGAVEWGEEDIFSF